MAGVALFVIDIQGEFISVPETAIPHAHRIRDAATEILHRARNEATTRPKIVIVQHAENGPDATMNPGSKSWELVFPCLDGAENEMLVAKTAANTFESNPSLAATLKSQGVRKIVAFGIQSDKCVRATCRGAVNAGFEVVLLRGAHSTYDNKQTGQSAKEVETEVERQLSTLGVKVVPWDTYKF
ncbi:hypothetical protein ARAM_006805 [Aspergillus rambellii]|uniref:Isochorismatase-like domain-containing protein n=2 Tax=Aspergillus subgen. Nidulantes TaxID=2720870 RepID=A0A0F8UGR7_9EURO|nr:hypothetical protein AOCH_004346 [Aspergillus ochraceoroseus]KKK18733.1 hypothetical protein ARAM_006805 [Aspergillus rambellii]